MNKMNIDDLRELLVVCAGGEAAELQGDIGAVSFDDLGLDSLALIETATQLKLQHGVVVPEERITEVQTPDELLALVNEHVAV